MVPSLPQNDPNCSQRNAALKEQRQKYQYDLTKLEGVAMVKQVPAADISFSKFQWTKDAVSLILRVMTNQRLQEINEHGIQLCSAVRFLSSIGLYNLLNNPRKANFLKWLLTKLQFLIQRSFQPKSDKENKRETTLEVDLEKDTKFIASSITELASIVSEKHSHAIDKVHIPADFSPPGDSMLDYRDCFKPYDDLFQVIYLPCIRQTFYEDRAFATHRVAGPNPLVIEKVTKIPSNFPVTDTQYKAVMGTDDSLSDAEANGRLYLADYAVLKDIETSDFPEAQKYLCAPLALFAVPKGTSKQRSLVPIAIQCGQEPGPTVPIFTPPPIGAPQSQQWSWLMAKTIVQIADGNYHELISHLGRTHLLVEVFVLATYQQLPPQHPLHVLLTPHFEGTLFINDLALKGLINKGGTVDKVLSGKLNASLTLSAQSVHGYPFDFNESMVPQTFVTRGVDDFNELPDYPYRDDALLIWDAIHQWVSNYLGIYYLNDEDVCGDTELQTWLDDLLNPEKGNLVGIGESSPEHPKPSIRTLDYLTDAVTLLIFTCSAQHAAVNFPQSRLMTYAPNMPLAGYRSAPTSPTGATVQDYFDLLPSLEQAETQMNMTYPLGSVYYTRLGEYGKTYFEDSRVKEHLEAFQKQLKEIEILIDDRNTTRPTRYEYLHPANIPQSINI